MKIQNKIIGDKNPVFVIAEIGMNHNGIYDNAIKLIDLAYEAGADCVKFQMRDLKSLYSEDALNLSSSDLSTQYTLGLLKKFELNYDEFKNLYQYTQNKGIIFMCTPWDLISVDKIDSLGSPGFKIASADLTNLEFRRSFNNFIDSCILISDRIRKRESPGKYDVVLFDEKANMETLGKRHPNSQLLQFNKSYSDSFNLEINSNRVFDLIFTGTTIQKTKNHELFYSIIDSILQKKPDLRVAIVGIQSEGEKLRKRWKKSNVEIFDRVGKRQLSNLFNKSRFHIITSSRDCFPRTIPESLVCGCHILTLDLLSDGLSLIEENPLLGTIIDTSGSRFSIENGYSLSVNASDYITDQITSQISVSRDHLLISALASELFPIQKMVQMDLIWQAADLNLNF